MGGPAAGARSPHEERGERRMKVIDVMSASTVAVSAEASLRTALERMERELFRHLPVLDHGRLVGVISERDILEATGEREPRFEEQAEGRPKIVRDTMQPRVETVAPDEGLGAAAALLAERGIGCLPVLDGDELVGVLTEHDLLRAYVRGFEGADAPSGDDPPVSEVMARDAVTAETTDSVGAALALCRANEVRHLPVMHEGWLVGVVSDRDLRLYTGRGEEAKPLEAVMSKELTRLAPHERLSAAAQLMLTRRIGSVLVTEADRLVGVVTTTDVVRRLAEA
jgi:CBS domain-containing protein